MGIESTYFHNMSISRIGDVVDEWGGIKQEYTSVPLLQLIPCAFSQGSRNNINAVQTESVNTVSYNPKLFCNPTLDILPGDRIEIRLETRLIGEFEASKPYYYNSHQEVPLLIRGEA